MSIKAQTFALMALACLLSACSNRQAGELHPETSPQSSTSETEAGDTIRVGTNDVNPEYLKLMDEYEEQLSSAPVYQSEIRRRLIEEPFKGSYLNELTNYSSLTDSHQFRCPHPAKVIGALGAQGWQLVRCNHKSAVFMREHGLADLKPCGHGLRIPHVFEVFYWRPIEAADNEKGHSRTESKFRYFAAGHRGNYKTLSIDDQKVAPFLSSDASEKERISFIVADFVSRLRFYDIAKRQIVEFQSQKHRKLKCDEHAVGRRLVANGHFVLRSPAKYYAEMDAKLDTLDEIGGVE